MTGPAASLQHHIAPRSPGSAPAIAGLLLAAGSGRRFGGPKALADTGGGPWVLRAVQTLLDTSPIVVVTGAGHEAVRALLPDGVIDVHNPAFATGMASSLLAGFTALIDVADDVDGAVIMLVDVPDVPREAIRRLISVVTGPVGNDVIPTVQPSGTAASTAGAGSIETVRNETVRNTVARAVYHGRPGHPVFIGAHHFAAIAASLRADGSEADEGARRYLAQASVVPVECGDLATGHDVDRPAR